MSFMFLILVLQCILRGFSLFYSLFWKELLQPFLEIVNTAWCCSATLLPQTKGFILLNQKFLKVFTWWAAWWLWEGSWACLSQTEELPAETEELPFRFHSIETAGWSTCRHGRLPRRSALMKMGSPALCSTAHIQLPTSTMGTSTCMHTCET